MTERNNALEASELSDYDTQCIQAAFTHLYGQEHFSAQLAPAPFDPSWAE